MELLNCTWWDLVKSSTACGLAAGISLSIMSIYATIRFYDVENMQIPCTMMFVWTCGALWLMYVGGIFLSSVATSSDEFIRHLTFRLAHNKFNKRCVRSFKPLKFRVGWLMTISAEA